MVAGLLILAIFLLVFWLVFFKLKLLKLSPAWGVVFSLVFVHVLLIFLIGMRFVTPYSTDARVIQHTIQLIPRLPEPTLVTAVLVAPDSVRQARRAIVPIGPSSLRIPSRAIASPDRGRQGKGRRVRVKDQAVSGKCSRRQSGCAHAQC